MQVILTEKLQTKWWSNQKSFLIPLALLYLGFIISRITKSGVSFEAFIPTPGELTALVLYVLNAMFDYLKKLSA